MIPVHTDSIPDTCRSSHAVPPFDAPAERRELVPTSIPALNELHYPLDPSQSSWTEPGRAGPSLAWLGRAEPSRAEPSRAEPSRAEPSRAEPSRAEPSRAGREACRSTSRYLPSMRHNCRLGCIVIASDGSLATAALSAQRQLMRDRACHRCARQPGSHRASAGRWEQKRAICWLKGESFVVRLSLVTGYCCYVAGSVIT